MKQKENNDAKNRECDVARELEANDDELDSQLIFLWTNKFLEEGESSYSSGSKQYGLTTVAFGRSTTIFPLQQQQQQQQEENRKENITGVAKGAGVPQQRHPPLSSGGNRLSHYANVPSSSNPPCSEDDSNLKNDDNNKNNSDNQKKKLNGKLRLDNNNYKGECKLKRRIQYSQEIRNSKQCAASLHIDSITRVVIQGFRKIINCERCALFLVDNNRKELYFKPVGGTDHHHHHRGGVEEIRFCMSAGIAGWVATNKEPLNIADAYQDHRFNQQIDKQTNFRTRNILCMPVMSTCGDDVIGVVQMVNKFKDDSRKMSSSGGTRTDTSNRRQSADYKKWGYKLRYESFSLKDETLLKRCCEQTATALEEAINVKSTTSSSSSSVAGFREKLQCGLEEQQSATALRNNSGGEGDTASENTRTASSAPGQRQHTPPPSEKRLSQSRRSSLGLLAQYVKSETAKSGNHSNSSTNQGCLFGEVASVNEAFNRFQFRNESSGPQISGISQSDPDKAEAAKRRQRMKDYFQSNVVKDPGAAATTTVSSGGDSTAPPVGGRRHKTFFGRMMTSTTTTLEKTGDDGTAAAAGQRSSMNDNETPSRSFGRKTMIAGNIGKMAPESQSNWKEFNRLFNKS